jgi:hypothetical protein
MLLDGVTVSSMEQWWMVVSMGKLKKLEAKPAQCHSIYH